MSITTTYWSLVLQDIESKIPAIQYNTWFDKLQMVSTAEKGKKLVIKSPSSIHAKYIDTHFKKELKESVNKYFPQVSHINYEFQKKEELQSILLKQEEIFAITQDNKDSKDNIEKQNSEKINFDNKYLDSNDKEYNNSSNSIEIYKPILPKKNIHNLNTRCNFDNLITCSYNELAISVAKGIIRQPGTLYNPVFIYSSTGLGKTHILQAIGHKLLEERPSFNIRYVSSETFLNHFIVATQNNKKHEFIDYYRNVDILLIDDIQFIAGKVGTQEAFFHTFNELHQQNKQIVITSDRPPKALAGLEERLASRFEWGMVIDLSQPTLEDRMSIISDKCQRQQIPLTERQILTIAQEIQTNIRDIEGVINKIQARIQLQPGQFVDDIFIGNILKPFSGVVNQGMMQFQFVEMQNNFNGSINNQTNNQPILSRTAINTKNPNWLPNHKTVIRQIRSNHNRLFAFIEKEFGISKEVILSKKRDKNTVLARQVLMYLLHKQSNISMKKIGLIIGGRKHTTVIHGIRKIEKQATLCYDLDLKLSKY
jgi:chromosomal replication initiator protein